MWDHSKSLLLTAWWMRIALVVWCVLAVAVPVLCWMQRLPLDMALLFGVLFVPVLLAFYGLYKMLHNIQQGIIFSTANTASLRLVSVFFCSGIFAGIGNTLADFDCSFRCYRVSGAVCACHQKYAE